MVCQNIDWELLDLLAGDWKDHNPSALELQPLGSWDIHMLHDGSYNTGGKWFK